VDGWVYEKKFRITNQFYYPSNENAGIGRRIILKSILNKQDANA
jgi:hypothetical protein